MGSLYRFVKTTNNTATALCSRFNTTPITTTIVKTKSTTAAAAAAAIPKLYFHPLIKKSINPSSASTLIKNGKAAAATLAIGGISSFSGATSSSFIRNTGYFSSTFSQQIYQQQQQQLHLKPQHYEQQQQFRNLSSLQIPNQLQQTQRSAHQDAMAGQGKQRSTICYKEITKNIILYTKEPLKSEIDQKTLEIKTPTGNPLVVITAWLMAKQKHLKKYAELYVEMGFDVMIVQITPWQLLWPAKGTQVVAAEALQFLESNKSYSPIVVHGFSVGAYQFGEIMLQMARDMDRYSQVLDRIACQIWDSAADIDQIPVGVPKSIFPRNPRMQNALRNYILYHLKTFHNQATIHYMRSSQMFHGTIVKTPALFFVSDNDPIGPPFANQAVRENWERANIPVTFKCWEKSMHASHYIKHPDEYLEFLYKHLETCGVMEAIKLKSRAKL